jgi:hypothetical protein
MGSLLDGQAGKIVDTILNLPPERTVIPPETAKA